RLTGRAMSELAGRFESLGSDIVLVVGDRVEAFAAASAAHIANRVVAHVHGGDRALGRVDDSLRHAITKLAHVHFAATRDSARRIVRLGEDRTRVHWVGSPGVETIGTPVGSRRGSSTSRYALISLHPVDSEPAIENRRARIVLRAVRRVGFDQTVIVYPNNDPGASGIVRCWESEGRDDDITVHRNLDRNQFLELLRRAAVLVGNSSSGIIEAASFGTPVVDVGPRQTGRMRNPGVVSVPYSQSAIRAALENFWHGGVPRRLPRRNLYRRAGTARRIAAILAGTDLSDRAKRKLIAY
ncbi:MAG: UDP-N-acetylglucosamine 2-epimerase, partial [Tepidisphaeraceae bacterium]